MRWTDTESVLVTIRQFWHRTFLLPRIALATAGVSVLLNLGSYAGLTMRGPFEPLAIMHLIVMALGFALFIRIGYHHWLSFRAPTMRKLDSPVPARLVALALVSILYFLVVFAVLGTSWGEGGAEVIDGRSVWVHADTVIRVLKPGEAHRYDAQELRVFSAGWLMFTLIHTIAGHMVERRIRGMRPRNSMLRA